MVENQMKPHKIEVSLSNFKLSCHFKFKTIQGVAKKPPTFSHFYGSTNHKWTPIRCRCHSRKLWPMRRPKPTTLSLTSKKLSVCLWPISPSARVFKQNIFPSLIFYLKVYGPSGVYQSLFLAKLFLIPLYSNTPGSQTNLTRLNKTSFETSIVGVLALISVRLSTLIGSY